MRNGVILNYNYRNVLELEALSDGLTDLTNNNTHENVEFVLRLKKTYDNRIRQKLFQTILLYDEVFVFMPLHVELKNLGNYMQINYGTLEEVFSSEFNEAYIIYIQPMVEKQIRQYLKYFYSKDWNISLTEFVRDVFCYFSELDRCSALENRLSETIKICAQKCLINNKIEFEDELLFQVISAFNRSFAHVVYNLETSVANDAAIMGLDLQELDAPKSQIEKCFRILKIEQANLLGELPCFSNITEVIETKNKRRKDIKRLRQVLSELENILREGGTTSAIKKAENDIIKANAEMCRSLNCGKISRYTTYISLPISIAETIIGASFGGLVITAGSFLTQLYNDYTYKKNNWLSLLR